jgi:hypothetical protein
MRPYALRPPVRGFGLTSDFSGLSLVISEKSETDWNRRPALVGFDLVALGEGDDGALLVGALPPGARAAVALALAPSRERVDVGDAHAEDRLDGVLDLDLVRARRDLERVDVRVERRVRLLRDDRTDDHVTRVVGDHSLSSVASGSPASGAAAAGAEGATASPARRATVISSVWRLNTSQSLTSTS